MLLCPSISSFYLCVYLEYHLCRKFINSYLAPIVQFMISRKSDIDKSSQEEEGTEKRKEKKRGKKTRRGFIFREEDANGDEKGDREE